MDRRGFFGKVAAVVGGAATGASVSLAREPALALVHPQCPRCLSIFGVFLNDKRAVPFVTQPNVTEIPNVAYFKRPIPLRCQCGWEGDYTAHRG